MSLLGLNSFLMVLLSIYQAYLLFKLGKDIPEKRYKIFPVFDLKTADKAKKIIFIKMIFIALLLLIVMFVGQNLEIRS